MKRSYSLPKWRQELGHFRMNESKPVYEDVFFSSDANSVIQRWIPRLRESIGLLQPIAQYFDYRLVDRRERWMVEVVNEHTKCNPLLLLGQRQAMCPEDFPLADTSRSSFKWCLKDGKGEQTINGSTHQRIECPGFPDYPCCNYNPHIRPAHG